MGEYRTARMSFQSVIIAYSPRKDLTERKQYQQALRWRASPRNRATAWALCGRGGGGGFGGLGGGGFGGFDGTMALGILKIRIHECRNCRISNWQWSVIGYQAFAQSARSASAHLTSFEFQEPRSAFTSWRARKCDLSLPQTQDS
jgi:hypothetical protein